MSDAIVLVGLPGCGKSSVGKLVAEALARPFVDLDALIAARTGCSPARSSNATGEARFREMEAAEVAGAVAVPGAVIATGGGAVIDPLNRWALVGCRVRGLARRARRTSRRARCATPMSGDRWSPATRPRRSRACAPRASRSTRQRTSASSRQGTARTVADDHRGRRAWAARPAARRLFDARVRRDHPMGPREARIVLRPRPGRADAGAAHRQPVRRAARVVVADERAAEALPGLMAALPGDAPAGHRGGRAGQAAALAWSAPGGRRRPARRTRRRLGRGRWRHHRRPRRHGRGAVPPGRAAHRGAHHLAGPVGRGDRGQGRGGPVPRPRTRPAPSGRRWRSSGTSRRCARSARDLLLDGLAEIIKSAIIGDPWLWTLLETRGEAALAGRRAGPLRDGRARDAAQARGRRPRPVRAGRAADAQPGPHPRPRPGDREPLPPAPRPGGRARAARRDRHRGGRGRRARPRRAHRRPARGVSAIALHRSFDRAAVRDALGSDKKRVAGRQRWILPLAIGTRRRGRRRDRRRARPRPRSHHAIRRGDH